MSPEDHFRSNPYSLLQRVFSLVQTLPFASAAPFVIVVSSFYDLIINYSCLSALLPSSPIIEHIFFSFNHGAWSAFFSQPAPSYDWFKGNPAGTPDQFVGKTCRNSPVSGEEPGQSELMSINCVPTLAYIVLMLEKHHSPVTQDQDPEAWCLCPGLGERKPWPRTEDQPGEAAGRRGGAALWLEGKVTEADAWSSEGVMTGKKIGSGLKLGYNMPQLTISVR